MIERVVGFKEPQDVAVLNKILQKLDSPGLRATIKYFSAPPTSDQLASGELGILDTGSLKRFYFKTNLGNLAYIEVGSYDPELGAWVTE